MQLSSDNVVVLPEVKVRHLGLCDYESTWEAMKEFTAERTNSTADELWVLQHPPVYTLGQAGKDIHILNPGDIPILHCDRGGQVTYHGPGQVVIYLLLDLKRLEMGVRQLVTCIEQAVVGFLSNEGIEAQPKKSAPGVYVSGEKISALGLRIRKGCSYHGLSLNVDMDLSPFKGINPCGYESLGVTQLKSLGVVMSVEKAGDRLVSYLFKQLGLGASAYER